MNKLAMPERRQSVDDQLRAEERARRLRNEGLSEEAIARVLQGDESSRLSGEDRL